jgi:tryptophan 6-halogenase
MDQQKHIVIVGGGTAGWMAANLFQQQLGQLGIRCSLIESPDIPTVGVGEGSTPQLKQFFQQLGVAESEWMSACHATYKNGIQFSDWSTEPGYTHYFHPFPSAVDKQTAKGFLQHCIARQRNMAVDVIPDRFFLAAQLAQRHLSPKLNTHSSIPLGYAYHFDAGMLGQFLQKLATRRGVSHVSGKVISVQQHLSQAIASVTLDDGRIIEGDIFIDCSGFQSLLMQQHLAVPFHSYSTQLFNDAAVAVASPRLAPLMSQTKACALSHGWRWQIPLTHRTGNGYVFSSAYCDAQQASDELIQVLGLNANDCEIRHLKMKVGRVTEHWRHNCLALGLAQGFIEPLEATALHLVQVTLESFISAWQAGGFSQQHQAEFNQRINARFDGIRDYIMCHYLMNSRTDSQYWIDNRHNPQQSDSLRALLDCWFAGGDLIAEINRQQIAAYYPVVSWYCLLAGYGRFPNQTVGGRTQLVDLKAIDDHINTLCQHFLSHEQALQDRSV